MTNLRAQRLNIKRTKSRRGRIEPAQRPGEQRNRSTAIAATEMMEGCTDLNQRLQKALLRLMQIEPDALPMLVSFKELLGPIAMKPFSQ